MEGSNYISQKKRIILVPIDYSDYSKMAVRHAAIFAEKLNASIYLFHAYFLPTFEIADITGQSLSFSDLKTKVLSNLEEREQEQIVNFENEVRQEIKTTKKSELNIQHVLIPGIPDEELVRFSELHKPLLIVLGINIYGNISRPFFGNTTENIIRKSKVPILIIPEDYHTDSLNKAKNIGFLTHFDEGDFQSIRKLMLVTEGFGFNIKCMHVTNTINDSWEKMKLVGLREYFKKIYEKENVECFSIESKSLLTELTGYIENKEMDILAFTLKKRNIISKLLKTDVSKKIINNLSVPSLVFHC